jgi:hypothetical protein
LKSCFLTFFINVFGRKDNAFFRTYGKSGSESVFLGEKYVYHPDFSKKLPKRKKHRDNLSVFCIFAVPKKQVLGELRDAIHDNGLNIKQIQIR